MDWKSNILKELTWSQTIINKEQKEKIAIKIAEKVNDGDIIGVGSGSTVYVALLAIARRINIEGLKIKAISTSMEITLACINLGIPITNIIEHKPDWLFDGADEVDPNKNLIKGRGGALFKEKLLMSSSTKNFIIIDNSKLVSDLCTNFPIPIEVFPDALLHVENKLKELGSYNIILRLAKGKDGPIITENGNLLLDVWFKKVNPNLEEKIKLITGVIESGLFVGYPIEILVADR